MDVPPLYKSVRAEVAHSLALLLGLLICEIRDRPGKIRIFGLATTLE